ncbi:MAG: pilus assembly protein PilM [Myxococcota bacterium]|nr:pilus assembly protein PilM [Myxococcota bacterium]
MAKVIGIDLGAHTVKVAVMEGRLGNMELTELRLRNVPPPEPALVPDPVPVAEGEEGEELPAPPPPPPASPSLGARLATLAALLEDIERDENTTYAAALPANRVSVRLVPMPFADRDRIAQTLPFELEGYVPFDLEDFILDWRVQPTDTGARVLAAMAHRQSVQELLTGLQAMDVDPKHLVLDAEVLGAFAPDTGTQAVVDLGHDRSTVALVRDGEVLAVRALSRAGRDLTEGLSFALGMSPQDAEAAKLVAEIASEGGIAGPAATEVDAEWEGDEHTDPLLGESTASPNLALKQKEDLPSALMRALDPLLAELRASLIALEDELGLGIDEVLITGGTAGLRGLPAQLSHDLGVPVRRVDLGPVAEAAGDPERFGLSVMLARRAGGIAAAQAMNFRKGEFAFKGDVALARTVVGVGLIALLMFGLVGTGIFLFQAAGYRSELAEIRAENREMVADAFPDAVESELSDPRNTAFARNLEATTRRDNLGSTVGGEPPVLTTLMTLTELSPKSAEAPLDISDLSITESTITFKAETVSFDAASQIEKALQAEPRFSEAKKANETKAGQGIRFDMSIPLPVDEDEEEDI